MKKIAALIGAAALTWVATASGQHHVRSPLVPVEGSGVTGVVSVVQLPHGGANITVVARGLAPGETYVSLYYENHFCELEPDSEDDVVGTYGANAAGVGQAHGKIDDDLDEINSISVRRASDLELLACANTNP